MIKLRKVRRCETGAVAIEFALISMAILIVLFGLVELGRGLYLYNKISYVIDLASRSVLTRPDITDQLLSDEISRAFTGEATSPNVTITPGSSGTGNDALNFKIIVISIPFKPLIPGLINDPITLRIARRAPILP